MPSAAALQQPFAEQALRSLLDPADTAQTWDGRGPLLAPAFGCELAPGVWADALTPESGGTAAWMLALGRLRHERLAARAQRIGEAARGRGLTLAAVRAIAFTQRPWDGTRQGLRAITETVDLTAQSRQPASPAAPFVPRPKISSFLDALPCVTEKLRRAAADQGWTSLEEIPAGALTAEQLRVRSCAMTGNVWADPGALAPLAQDPALFLDFECAQPLVPRWPGYRAGENAVFEFSLRGLRGESQLFLDLTGEDPAGRCAQALCEWTRGGGPIWHWGPFEAQTVSALMRHCPERAGELAAVRSRLQDMLALLRGALYHPAQRGGWRLKEVYAAWCPGDPGYRRDAVHDGEEAALAWLAATHPKADAPTKEKLRTELSEYCAMDTLALVKLREAALRQR